MGFNPRKELDRIKEALGKKGFTKDIPIDVFGIEVMIIIGSGKRKASEWIDNFEMMNWIKKVDDKVNFV